MAKILRKYHSTIYGDYRKAYIKYGFVTGVVVSVVVLVNWLLNFDNQSMQPSNWLTEIVFALGIGWFTYRYRQNLSNQMVTFKELMMLGLGIGVVGSVLYGLALWFFCGVAFPEMGDAFIAGRLAMMPDASVGAEEKIAIDTVRGYTAGDWGFIGGFRSAVMSVLIAFFAAIIFRTEKGEVVS